MPPIPGHALENIATAGRRMHAGLRAREESGVAPNVFPALARRVRRSATKGYAGAFARLASAWRTAGATTVPNSSIERITAACGVSPTRICIR